MAKQTVKEDDLKNKDTQKDSAEHDAEDAEEQTCKCIFKFLKLFCVGVQNIIKKNLFIFLYIVALKSSRKHKANKRKRGPTGYASKKHKSKHVEEPEEEEKDEELEEGKSSEVVYDENSDKSDDEEETGEDFSQETKTGTALSREERAKARASKS